jgi:alkanesulfonate monooxygenase SsuD/methylene tetrahydromethanopterin reductase-like flavin-dependent oxidoreductase (luciferase family)
MCAACRNPALLAKMADTVDEVSAGRLILGFGARWHEPEFRAFGYPFDHLASRFEETLRIIAPLVRGDAVDYRGIYEQAVDRVSLSRGPQPEGPPILDGPSGPRMLRLTAELGEAWYTCWLARASELPQRRA